MKMDLPILDLEASRPFLLVVAATFAFIVALYLLYYTALPKPIPGVPYHEASSRRLFGDVPAMMAHIKNEDGTFITYLEQTLQKLNAPMVQVFIKPWSRPLLILGDFREARDIMARRTAEFDRSTSSGDLVRGLGPSHHIHLKTSPAWRAQRRLIQDLMSSAFLHHVAGPVMYQNVLLMVDLWRVKSRIAGGRPWAASEDIDHVALDSVLSFAFGEDFGRKHSATRGALDVVAANSYLPPKNSSGLDEPVAFDPVPADDVLNASLELVAAVEDVQGSPFPDLKWWWVNNKPRIRRATQIKEKYIRDEVADAVRRLKSSAGEEFVKSAVDHMVFRESKLAEKEARKPDFFSRVMMDEVRLYCFTPQVGMRLHFLLVIQ